MKTEAELLRMIGAALTEALEKEVSVQPATRLRADVGIQSIDVIDFLFILERATGTRIEIDEFFQYLATRSSGVRDIVVSDIIGFIQSKQGA